MLKIIIPPLNGWDENLEEFVDFNGCTLLLEHSLLSISKWESKWHKPFLTKNEKTNEEIMDYIRCMTTNPNIDSNVYRYLSSENLKDIQEYISDSQTATTIYQPKNESGGYKKSETITSELIYYWMIALNIPVEFQKWHINRLLTLIRVCNIKNSPPKTMSKHEILSRNAALNASRRAALGSKG